MKASEFMATFSSNSGTRATSAIRFDHFSAIRRQEDKVAALLSRKAKLERELEDASEVLVRMRADAAAVR